MSKSLPGWLDYTDEEWEKIEDRVLKNIPVSKVKSPEDFKKQLMDKFFQGKDEGELTEAQKDFGEVLWDDLKDEYTPHFKKEEPKIINISLKAYPNEAKRFMKSLNLYHAILKQFQKGYHRNDVTRYYSEKTGRKYRTVQRDISAMVKIGVIKRRKSKLGRGYYDVEPNVYV
jgi:hypothetical protein